MRSHRYWPCRGCRCTVTVLHSAILAKFGKISSHGIARHTSPTSTFATRSRVAKQWASGQRSPDFGNGDHPLPSTPPTSIWIHRYWGGAGKGYYGCWTAQKLFPVFMTCIYLIYMYFACSPRLKQLNFDFTKCKIPTPRYISHIPPHLLDKNVIPLHN